ncbi:MAG: hypothetical protein KDK76_01505 [Chlamydiia bacterium]|nr:hypothetical protein [Chlamydiia bacterium]
MTGSDEKNLIDWAQKVEKALFGRGILVYTAFFHPHSKEAYLLAQKIGAVLLLVGHDRYKGACCLSFPGVDKSERIVKEILDYLDGT